MKIGVFIHLTKEGMEQKFKDLADRGFDNCQLDSWHSELWTDEMAEHINELCKKYGVTISAFWCGWQGPAYWNFYEGQETLGLVPPVFRYARMKDIINGSDFAKKLGVTDVITHVGFLPENPHDPNYPALLAVLQTILTHIKQNGQYFLFETGQETPVTLLRTIEALGCENLGINLDPANLIMYGKANPVDALDVFGKYVRGIHAKDGKYPTDGKNLGPETPLGEGKVNYPVFIKRLHEIGYDGCLTIEREIDGDEQLRDIENARKTLNEILATL